MAESKKTGNSSNMDQMIAEARRTRQQLETSYRERAMKMYPKICARCGREFSGKKLRELTVHHKDHNHDNNPPDGSNWELLCLYCHDNEHARDSVAEWYDDAGPDNEPEESSSGINLPFAGLADLLKGKK